MSSSDDEGCVGGAGLDLEGGEQAGGRRAHPMAPRVSRPARDLETPTSSEGFESEAEGVEAGGRVLWGREGRPGSPADVQEHTLGHLADEAATTVLQQLIDRDPLGTRRNPSPESCSSEASSVWVDLRLVPRGRGTRAHSWVGFQPLTSAGLLRPRGHEGGRLWGIPKRGVRGRSSGTVYRRRPSTEGLIGLLSDPESSDEMDISQVMKVTIGYKGRGQAKPSIPEGPGSTPKHLSTPIRESFLHVPGHFLSSTPRGPISAVESQVSGEGDVSSSNKTTGEVWGKVESRPSYQGAAAAAGGLRGSARWRSVSQEKRPLVGSSNLILGRSFPPWGQRMLPTYFEPGIFPTITAMPLLPRTKKSCTPSGIRQSKYMSYRKKPIAKKTRESELKAGDDKDPKGQPPAQKPGPSLSSGNRTEFSGSDFNVGGSVVPRCSQPSSLSQGDVLAGGPAPSGDQEALDPASAPAPGVDRQQELPPGAEGCPRCPELQKEVDTLKEKLAALERLIEKFLSP